MLLQLSHAEPEEAPKPSIPQLRASHQQQQTVPTQSAQPKQPGRAPALQRTAGSDMAARSKQTALTPETHMLPAGNALEMITETLEQSSKGMLPCHSALGAQRASRTQPQKPVFGKHKRLGPPFQAKDPAGSKAIPSRIKVGAVDADAYTSF